MMNNVDVEIAKKGKCRECGKKYNEITLYRLHKQTSMGDSYSYICQDCCNKTAISVINIVNSYTDIWMQEVLRGTSYEGYYG